MQDQGLELTLKAIGMSEFDRGQIATILANIQELHKIQAARRPSDSIRNLKSNIDSLKVALSVVEKLSILLTLYSSFAMARDNMYDQPQECTDIISKARPILSNFAIQHYLAIFVCFLSAAYAALNSQATKDVKNLAHASSLSRKILNQSVKTFCSYFFNMQDEKEIIRYISENKNNIVTAVSNSKATKIIRSTIKTDLIYQSVIKELKESRAELAMAYVSGRRACHLVYPGKNYNEVLNSAMFGADAELLYPIARALSITKILPESFVIFNNTLSLFCYYSLFTPIDIFIHSMVKSFNYVSENNKATDSHVASQSYSDFAFMFAAISLQMSLYVCMNFMMKKPLVNYVKRGARNLLCDDLPQLSAEELQSHLDTFIQQVDKSLQSILTNSTTAATPEQEVQQPIDEQAINDQPIDALPIVQNQEQAPLLFRFKTASASIAVKVTGAASEIAKKGTSIVSEAVVKGTNTTLEKVKSSVDLANSPRLQSATQFVSTVKTVVANNRNTVVNAITTGLTLTGYGVPGLVVSAANQAWNAKEIVQNKANEFNAQFGTHMRLTLYSFSRVCDSVCGIQEPRHVATTDASVQQHIRTFPGR